MSEEDLKNNIILDRGYSIDIFRNPHLIKDINRSNQMIHTSTKVVYKIKQMQAVVVDYVKLWYDDKSIANILSLNNLVKKFRVTYDSHQDDYLTIHTNRGSIKFKRNKQELQVFNPTYTT